MSERLVIAGGRVIDPASGFDGPADVVVFAGRIEAIAPPGSVQADRTIDAEGCWVVPGLVDLHTHLRNRGFGSKEDVASGGRAAAAGGFTTVCCMANTEPVNDTRAVTEYIVSRAREQSPVRVLPIGAVTVGLAGKSISEMADMQEGGIVAVSDDGQPVSDAGLYRRAMEYARGLGLPVVGHCEDCALRGNGQMNEGAASTRAGLPGNPAVAEVIAVERDLQLAALTGVRFHVAHLSTAGAVEAVRRAKAAGVAVTAEVTPHHLVLTDEDLLASVYDTHFKMAPPLRSAADRQAVREALADGTIDCVATDHAPHSDLEKRVEFARAANGIVGLETAVSLVLSLVRDGVLSDVRAIDSMTRGAADCFGLPDAGRLAVGGPADVTVIDPDAEWTVCEDTLHSRSMNSPFLGKTLRGRARHTFVAGKQVWG